MVELQISGCFPWVVYCCPGENRCKLVIENLCLVTSFRIVGSLPTFIFFSIPFHCCHARAVAFHTLDVGIELLILGARFAYHIPDAVIMSVTACVLIISLYFLISHPVIRVFGDSCFLVCPSLLPCLSTDIPIAPGLVEAG